VDGDHDTLSVTVGEKRKGGRPRETSQSEPSSPNHHVPARQGDVEGFHAGALRHDADGLPPPEQTTQSVEAGDTAALSLGPQDERILIWIEEACPRDPPDRPSDRTVTQSGDGDPVAEDAKGQRRHARAQMETEQDRASVSLSRLETSHAVENEAAAHLIERPLDQHRFVGQ
jgi:hypothetical protein